MKLALFIAKRIADAKSKGFANFILKLAIVATALSVAVMIISVAVVLGFRDTIQNKMFVFWGQIEITPFSPNPANIITPDPFKENPKLISEIRKMPEVNYITPFGLKPVILKVKDGLMEGLKLKGVDSSYIFQNNASITFTGQTINFPDSAYSKDLIVSQTTLDRLNSKVGDSVLAFFVDPNNSFPRIRKLGISGVYHTGMTDIDQSFAYCDINLLRRIGNWDNQAINGYQIGIKDYRQSDTLANKIYQKYLDPPLYTSTLAEIYPNIYNWLNLINRNVYIILIIMAVVAVINLSTALLVFILERTNMTGILKSMGMQDKELRRIFLYHAGIVAIKGIVYGTIGGVLFCLLQSWFHFIPLPESTYYMSYVPIKLNLLNTLLIDLGTFIFCFLLMTIPTLFIRKINLIKAIKFQ